MTTWKERNWERYVAQEKQAEARPEYLTKRRARYVPTGNPRGRTRLLLGEEALERKGELAKVRSKAYRERKKISADINYDETHQAKRET